MKKEVRDRNNLIIGWENDLGSQIQALHRLKGVVGFYNKGSNITFDKSGRIYAYGDAVQCLVRDAERGLL